MTQLLYVGLHLKPLAPLTSNSTPVNEMFLRQLTTGQYFASELLLLWLLAFASPIRSVLLSSLQTYRMFALQAHVMCDEGLIGSSKNNYTRSDSQCMCRNIIPIAIVGVHAAFHVLYTILSTFCREWSLQQNVSRIQVGKLLCSPPCLVLSGTETSITLQLLHMRDGALPVLQIARARHGFKFPQAHIGDSMACQVPAVMQILREGGQSIPRTLWAWLLNLLNLADAGLHLLYLLLFARQLC